MRSRRHLVISLSFVALLLSVAAPAAAATPPSDPQELTNVGNVLFFSADDGVNGRELWRSDGTAAGTKMVRNLAAGANSANPLELTAVGSRLFFTAAGGGHGRSLWVTDGTSAGTKLVKDINDGDLYLGSLLAFKNKLFKKFLINVICASASHKNSKQEIPIKEAT